MKKEFIGFLSLAMTIQMASAQDTLVLSLSDAVNAAITHNREVTLATFDQKSATVKFGQTNAIFLPQVTLSYSAAVTNNPLYAFGFKLQQQSVSPSDFNPALLNHPGDNQNYFAKVELNQPLLNGDLMFQRKAASKQIEVFNYKASRTKEYLAFEVQRSYAQLQLAHQLVLVLEESLTTVNTIHTTTQNYFDQGYLRKSDLLAVQVRVASIESKLEDARSNVLNVSDYLSLLMGVGIGSVYSVDSLRENLEFESVDGQVPDERTDFKALRSAITVQQFIVQSGKMAQLPKLNAFASYMFNDRAPLGFGSNSYLLGAQLSWNIFNGTASHYRSVEQKIALSRMEEQLQYQKEQSQLELNKTLRELAVAQHALRQYETSVHHAEEALRILQNRFQQGLVSINDLLQSQATRSEQKLFLCEATAKYNTTVALIKYLTTSDNK